MFVFFLVFSGRSVGVGGAHSSTAIQCMLVFGMQVHSDVASGPPFVHRVLCVHIVIVGWFGVVLFG